VRILEDKVEVLMKNLDVSEEEAREIIEYDKAVDKMSMTEVDSDLTPEQKEALKKYKNVATKTTAKKPFVPKLDKRPRKENGTKRGIIEDIFNALNEKGYENLTIVKAEKEISFDMGGDNYSISLICHRKPKK
jgi:hypothetical protein